MVKSGAQRVASRLGLALVSPDTSPRGLSLGGEDDSYDFGTGAGFYVDATVPKWQQYRMYSYVVKELPELLNSSFANLDTSKAFTGYLGGDRESWLAYDATELVASFNGPARTILIDQGDLDDFLGKGQLLPEDFKAAAENKEVNLELRMQGGYDHSYFFIATFIEDHLELHAKALLG